MVISEEEDPRQETMLQTAAPFQEPKIGTN